ncbi:MAG: hypothetical protein ACF8NJ_01305 [Phycisphaerales bacterium JB038]
MQPEQDATVIRQPVWFILAWFILGAGWCLAFLLFDRLVNMSSWVLGLFLGAGLLWLGCGIPMLAHRLVVSEEGIAQLGLPGWGGRRWELRWEDIDAWSENQGGAIFLRTRDGTVRGTSQKLTYGNCTTQLAALIEQHCGPPATGRDEVLPAWFAALFGTVGKRPPGAPPVKLPKLLVVFVVFCFLSSLALVTAGILFAVWMLWSAAG